MTTHRPPLQDNTALVPFANNSDSRTIGGMTVENGTDSIAFYGQTDLSRDKAGLERAQALLTFMQQVVDTLAAQKDLPDTLPPRKPAKVANPFA
ncbi:hypothetical protein LU298_08805 [Komagataeibacter intermedius]|uniref:Uncharacterized protein n=2 Tax=Komagataeibacter intermedius TaxID=66229 RepID=A0A0N1F7E4_9PROT|nr:hypothetical protein [Komagataeibacter intermedius]KPH85701.1 hypothetical protein GLUCOINTEAF2_0203218 [Komagataeibacter intermedius AF2]MCF3636600.1 hypothetical protein [Komagataeibacter intermedius]GAN86852.1 hypothetical protein Gain_0038_031 [Komagataeibacter intermedius TF2]GBQ67149.1 hypothetical protein AA0521_0922 [Komagataeibacter intermedius NRIC 0521]